MTTTLIGKTLEDRVRDLEEWVTGAVAIIQKQTTVILEAQKNTIKAANAFIELRNRMICMGAYSEEMNARYESLLAEVAAQSKSNEQAGAATQQGAAAADPATVSGANT